MEVEQVPNGSNDPLNDGGLQNHQLKVDPRNVHLVEPLMNPKSFHTYKKTWLDFINNMGINEENEPDENDFMNYLEKKRLSGYTGNTLKSTYSHLNKIYTNLYGIKLGTLSPRIYQLVETYSEGEAIKKGKIFTREEVLR